jgi:hypothetical protein
VVGAIASNIVFKERGEQSVFKRLLGAGTQIMIIIARAVARVCDGAHGLSVMKDIGAGRL